MVLYQVITNLDLNRKWGEKFKEGELPTDLSYKLLKSQIQVRPGRGTTLFEIRARSDDPAEAAAIANGIAGAYREQRAAPKNELSARGIMALDGEVQKLGSQVQELEGKLKRSGAKLNLAIDSDQPAGLEEDDPRLAFFRERRDLENLKFLREKLTARLVQEKVEFAIIKDYPVEIVDSAEPNFRPIKPHPVMKILVPIAGLLTGVIGVVFLMLGLMMKKSAKKPPPPLPA